MARLRAPERRRRILDTALPRFARDGYRATTTADLAAAAGVTVPILYRHFAGKRELYLALFEEAAGRLLEACREGVGDDPAALHDRLARGPRAADLGLVLDAVREAERQPAMRAAARRFLGRLHTLVAASVPAGEALAFVEGALGRALTSSIGLGHR